ncbi:putative F-box family protein [Quillaja saponaria]|uniref:F-box family protein n=1 Tax=Quillaja saponaria TaxID=32244 RepID=A0AAD7LW20_QUISA|nr:putative F-box family protein [Quillaja saponaria]
MYKPISPSLSHKNKRIQFCETVPQDIITDILSRLPVKSLIRFKSFSKFWFNLLKTPKFIGNHLQNSSRNNPSLLLHRRILHVSMAPSIMYLLQGEMAELEDVHIPTDGHFNSWLHIVDSCNGILCVNQFLGSNSMLWLWNPATREVKLISKGQSTSSKFASNFTIATGFGFSSQVDDYKVMRIYVYDNVDLDIGSANEIPRSNNVLLVEVYSLKTGSWKEITDNILEFWDYELYSVTVNGRMFWKALPWVDHSVMVLSFDLGEEVFKKIAMPGLLEYSPRAYMELLSYKNMLALLIYNNAASIFRSFDMWVMEYNSDGGEFWTKLFTIGPFPFTERPVGFWKDEIIFTINNRSFLCLFNPNTKERKNIPTDEDQFSFEVFNYAESLVCIDNSEFGLMDQEVHS